MMANDPRDIDDNGNPVDLDGDETVEEFETDESIDADELNLDEDDESLPWLESSDYDDEDEGVGLGRMIGFLLLGLLALALLIWGIWWASNRGSDPDMVADGSTIEAPEGDYKERPENPGGKQFEGTGDNSFKVGEGQGSEGTLADKNAPKPSVDAATTANASSGGNSTAAGNNSGANGSGSTATAPAATSGGYVVQVAALASKEAAQRGWNDIRGRTDALKGAKYKIVEGQADIGKVYRVQVSAGSKAAADKICAGMKADGLPCTVKKN